MVGPRFVFQVGDRLDADCMTKPPPHLQPQLAVDPPPAGEAAPAVLTRFDKSTLAEMFGAGSEVIASLLLTYRSSTQSCLAEMDQALAAQQLLLLAQLAHRIKGSSRMSGALALAEVAQALERAARAGDWEHSRSHVAELQQHGELLEQYLQQRASGSDALSKQ